MQGKTKSFFEDTSIVLVLAVIIIVGYTFYDNDSLETNSDTNTYFTTNNIDKFFTEIKKLPALIETLLIQEKNDSISASIENNETIILTDVPIDLNTTIPFIEAEIKPKKEIEAEKKVILEEKVINEEKTIVEKNIDLKMLKVFLKNLEIQLIQSIVENPDVNSTKSQNLRFRITLLKDGNYEQLTFVNGNKELFESNKENILKNFPIDIDDKIKDEFPRYIRINLK